MGKGCLPSSLVLEWRAASATRIRLLCVRFIHVQVAHVVHISLYSDMCVYIYKHVYMYVDTAQLMPGHKGSIRSGGAFGLSNL